MALCSSYRIKAATGFISAVTNAVSFGVSGGLVNAATAIDSVIDFGDINHLKVIFANNAAQLEKDVVEEAGQYMSDLKLKDVVFNERDVCWDVTTNRTRLQTRMKSRMKLNLVPVRGTRMKRMYARRKLILVPLHGLFRKLILVPLNENLCEVTPTTREQNNENVLDASGSQEQNNKTTREAKTHSGGKDTKQMTYREALIGVGNSESSSDF